MTEMHQTNEGRRESEMRESTKIGHDRNRGLTRQPSSNPAVARLARASEAIPSLVPPAEVVRGAALGVVAPYAYRTEAARGRQGRRQGAGR